MGKFKSLYMEGRDRWSVFTISKKDKRWSILNTETNQRYYIKLGENVNSISGMQRFLMDISATSPDLPKTKGEINFFEFAQKIMGKDSSDVYVKKGNWDKIKKTWNLEGE